MSAWDKSVKDFRGKRTKIETNKINEKKKVRNKIHQATWIQCIIHRNSFKHKL